MKRLLSIWLLLGGSGVIAQSADWPVYLGGSDSSQYSVLHQINRENVRDLEIAWTYDSDPDNDTPRGQIQCNPIVIDGVLYGTSPLLKVFAVDAATGAERWVYDLGNKNPPAVNRGVTYWADGDDRRILFCGSSFVYALNADTGMLIAEFGENGRIDLREGLGREVGKVHVGSSTPGVVYKDLIIFGTRTSEALPAAPGHIRAYNIRSGETAWTFHTIPQPGEFGYDTWPPDAYKYTGGANAWGGLSVDAERGLVYAPTGSAAYDFYGANRHGDNLFANCLIALRADTGERVWHFQTVRHDLWDRDVPAPPNLISVERGGQRVDAVAQITKSAHIFLFDRESGEPLFPIENHAVPESDLEGERTAPMQPLPSKPPPFSRQSLDVSGLATHNAESFAIAADLLKRSRSAGQFVPPSREGTIVYPGFDGGGEWGGAAVDPTTGIMYVNASEMAWVLQMVDIGEVSTTSVGRMGKTVYARSCLYCHGIGGKGDPLEEYPPLTSLRDKLPRSEASRIIKNGQGKMPSFPNLSDRQIEAVLDYFYLDDDANASDSTEDSDNAPEFTSTGYNRFVDANGNSVVKPPWGTLNAIDLNAGEIKWQVPLGDVAGITIEGIPRTGTENYGGPVVTAGGVVFIAASKNEMFHAYDRDTGDLLWEIKLPAGGYATPSTYMVDGRQFVVIAAGGGKMGTPSGDTYVAFALPEE
jgi:quinoprotein glucose dehydrogenase